ncbi:MAG: acyltransferase [Bacteroidia bacterium]|nr:acyltransferase [Bacteroidia bacterium]
MTQSQSTGFLGYLHSFRGFAILNIVAIHAFIPPLIVSNNMQGLDMSNPVAIANEVLFHDSTIYFAVISGILFSAILRTKGWRKFFTSKVKNVLLPYIFFTLLFSIMTSTESEPVALHSDLLSYLKTALNNFIVGAAQGTYWYMPVLFFLYIVTPLLDFLLHAKEAGKIALGIIILTPLAISRIPLEFVNPSLHIETMIYFTGAYAAGMWVGNDLENSIKLIERLKWPLIATAVLLSGLLCYFYLAEIRKIGFVSVLESVFYVQKLALSALFLFYFYKLEENQPKWMAGFARDSFAIYFLHMFFVLMTFVFLMPLFQTRILFPINIVGYAFIVFVFALTMSRLIIAGIRLLMGKRSRMLIGS